MCLSLYQAAIDYVPVTLLRVTPAVSETVTSEGVVITPRV